MSDYELQFMEITNASIEDAKRFLELTDNNVEEAIQLFFINGDAGLNQHVEVSPIIEEPEYVEQIEEPTIEEPAESTDDPMEAHEDFNPFEHFERTTMGGVPIQQFMRTNQFNFHREPMQQELFPPPSQLVHSMPIDRAQGIADTMSKWIFLIISDPAVFACQQINRDLLQNEFIQEILSNFYVVYYLSQSPNAQQFKQLYPFVKPPYICIIDPRTGERVKQYPQDHHLMKIDQNEWATELTNFLEEFDLNKSYIANVSPQEKRIDEMTEEEQIALALRQSMGQPETPRDSKDLMNAPATPNEPASHFSLALTPQEIKLQQGIKMATRLSSTCYLYRR